MAHRVNGHIRIRNESDESDAQLLKCFTYPPVSERFHLKP